MKHTMVPSNQEDKNHEFNILTKSFKKRCPWIKVRPPRMLCDRQTPPHLDKSNWIKKTQKNILRVDVQYPHQKENGHYINWRKFKKELKSKLNNQELDIHIWIVDEKDLIKVPKNLE